MGGLLRLLVLFFYPMGPALLGVLLVLAPRVLFGGLIVVGIFWAFRWVRGMSIGGLALSLPRAGFPAPVAALVVAVLAFQSVAGFWAGIALVAGWPSGRILITALAPSALVIGLILWMRTHIARRGTSIKG